MTSDKQLEQMAEAVVPHWWTRDAVTKIVDVATRWAALQDEEAQQVAEQLAAQIVSAKSENAVLRARVAEIDAQKDAILAEHDDDLTALHDLRAVCREVAGELRRAPMGVGRRRAQDLAAKLEVAAGGEQWRGSSESGPGSSAADGDRTTQEEHRLSKPMDAGSNPAPVSAPQASAPQEPERCPVDGCDGNPRVGSGAVKYISAAAQGEAKEDEELSRPIVTLNPNGVHEPKPGTCSCRRCLIRDRAAARAELNETRAMLEEVAHSAFRATDEVARLRDIVVQLYRLYRDNDARADHLAEIAGVRDRVRP